jgi:predicted small lipoprotein YifL
MKRTINVLFVLVCLSAIAGCGNKGPEPTPQDATKDHQEINASMQRAYGAGGAATRRSSGGMPPPPAGAYPPGPGGAPR